MKKETEVRPCHHVPLLRDEDSEAPYTVEEMDYKVADRSICNQLLSSLRYGLEAVWRSRLHRAKITDIQCNVQRHVDGTIHRRGQAEQSTGNQAGMNAWAFLAGTVLTNTGGSGTQLCRGPHNAIPSAIQKAPFYRAKSQERLSPLGWVCNGSKVCSHQFSMAACRHPPVKTRSSAKTEESGCKNKGVQRL